MSLGRGAFRRTGAAFVTLVVGVLLASAGSSPAANGSWHLSGGGTADLSQVSFNVRIDGSGGAKGSFECLMAGRSAWTLPAFGLERNMIVHAWPTEGTVSGPLVTFEGPGQLIADGQKLSIHVQVWANAATQRFELTIVELGGGPPVETLETGRISLR
jgi:hypothetical protein